MKKDELFIVQIIWSSTNTSPLIGPIVGLTKTQKFCTLIRKRLRLNKHAFVRVSYHRVLSPHWLMKFPFMRDSVDALLASVFADEHIAHDLQNCWCEEHV